MISGKNGVSTVKTSAPFHEGMFDPNSRVPTGQDVRSELARAIVAKDWDLLELRSIDVSLEDVFIDLVTEESGDILTKENVMDREVA